MKQKMRGPLGYIFSASLLPIGLLVIYDKFGGNNNHLDSLINLWLFFLMLSLLWDIIGMIRLVAKGALVRLAIGVSAILFQMGIYYWLLQTLSKKIAEISF